MLLVYLDESGIGNIEHEKHVVVAGVIIQAEQYKAVQKRIEEVRDKYVPERHRKGFVFHANELYQGMEKKISRDEFPLEQRRNALEELISILSEFHIPVVQGWHERAHVTKQHPELNSKKAVVLAQAIASTQCLATVEHFTRTYALQTSLALLIYENNDQCKTTVKVMQKQFQDPENLKKLASPKDYERASKVIPLQRVIDTAHFAEKSEAPMLQLADVCAYFINRRIMGRPDSMRFLKHIMNQLTSNAHSRWPTAIN